MCGIVGVADINKPEQALVQLMCDAIAHRGPDSDGFYFNERIGLGNRRLRVIDLDTGDQPIHNEDRTIWVVYNGEIYNYRELRDELESKGHSFYTQSDTETLVHLYEEYGERFPHKLNGIFAFALWDEGRQQLLLGRDYYGVKPLHYTINGTRLIFSSEIKSILLDPTVEQDVNLQALHLFLNLRYVPGDETLFKNIMRLPPGHTLIWSNGQFRLCDYWNDDHWNEQPVADEQEYQEGVRHYLSQAIRRQLVSDVPLGVYLSGGLDSSSIVAIASEYLNQPLQTFSLGFNEPTDELTDAQIVAQHFGTDHRELRLNPEPLRSFPRAIWHVEEPKENVLQNFLLAQFARQTVTVALGGLGGDELFAGYINNHFLLPSQPFHPLVPNSWVRGGARTLSRTLFKLQNRPHLRRFDEYRRGLQMLLSIGDPAQYYLILRNVWDDDAEQFSNVYGHALQSKMQEHVSRTRSYFDQFFPEKRHILRQALEAEFHTKMVDDFLLNEDRMSMAHGLEVRVPFLDRDLVSYAMRMPTSLKMRGLTTKYILKKAMSGILPQHTLRKKKWGFSFNPYYQFQKDLKRVAERILTREQVQARGWFNYDYLREIIEHPPHPRLRWHYFYLWNALGLEIWAQMFLEGNLSEPVFDIENYYS